MGRPRRPIGAVLFFLAVRGILSLLVSPLFGHTTLHFPLFLVEAAVVELVALRVARNRPLTLGAAGRARDRHARPGGRVGLVVRVVDDRVAREHAHRGRVCGFVAAVGGGVLGGFIGRALATAETPPQPVPRFALPAAIVAVVAVIAWATPISTATRSAPPSR